MIDYSCCEHWGWATSVRRPRSGCQCPCCRLGRYQAEGSKMTPSQLRTRRPFNLDDGPPGPTSQPKKVGM